MRILKLRSGQEQSLYQAQFRKKFNCAFIGFKSLENVGLPVQLRGSENLLENVFYGLYQVSAQLARMSGVANTAE